ncbi:MAG: 2-hydroxyacid dehydrogenase, partial [Acidimicrobiales bacterium]
GEGRVRRAPRMSRMMVAKVAPLVVSVPDANLAQALGDDAGVEYVVWDMSGPPPVPALDIVIPPYLAGTGWATQLAGVPTRLIQSPMVGYDGIADLLPSGVVYANAASVHETSTAELTLALILASQRGLPDFVRAAEKGHWAPAWHQSLADRSVLLVGYGGVGRAIAERLSPFEVTLTRVARTARTDERGEIYSIESLDELLPSADVVVVVVPLDDSTTRLIDDAFLSRMRDGTLLVNVSRGRVADTEALLKHASSGRLRIALDVTDPEPLPDGHPLFALENVLISPHVGGATTAGVPRLVRLIKEQAQRMSRGDEPLNVVLRT